MLIIENIMLKLAHIDCNQLCIHSIHHSPSMNIKKEHIRSSKKDKDKLFFFSLINKEPFK
uniref:Uncharacterized protein n=1 Tax=Schistosoma mansoni TaxID=6183 RepID=A0A5K4F2A3_SCHMA